ncbi:MAG: hypothetical protein ACI311_03765 [Bacilli bacterium]
MKKMDRDGLIICTLQGNLFLCSLKSTDCSSEIFMRRFMSSQISKEFDSLAILDDSLTTKEILNKIDEEFGESNYGTIKYEKEVIFWIGYIYRYFAYTYELSSKYIYKILKPKELNELYYVYHTFDPSVAIEKILEEKNISFDLDNQNERLLKMLRNQQYEKNVLIKQMTMNYANDLCNSFIINKDINMNEKYIKLGIIYKDENIGEISFKKVDEDYYKYDIYLKDDKYKNNGLETVAFKKSISVANALGIKKIQLELLKTNEKDIDIFKKLGYQYLKEKDNFVYYTNYK